MICPGCGAPDDQGCRPNCPETRVRQLTADKQHLLDTCVPVEELRHAEARIAELEAAIRAHRAAKADDRCIEDDDALYAALGDDIPCDRRVGDKFAMLRNCARFIENRCEGGGWPSYVEVEAERDAARQALDRFVAAANDALQAWDADRDSRVGKLLAALAGRLPGYRADVDAAHAVRQQSVASADNPTLWRVKAEWHYGAFGRAACGADVPNMRLTEVANHVTCPACRPLVDRAPAARALSAASTELARAAQQRLLARAHWHYGALGRAACGATASSLIVTQIVDAVTCPACRALVDRPHGED